MILPLKKQVCSPELAKRLKELGAPQDSLFYWARKGEYFISSGEKVKPSEPEIIQSKPPYDFPYEGLGSAYTSSELGELLPAKIYGTASDSPDYGKLEILKEENGNRYACQYSHRFVYWGDSLAEAMAQSLIHLLEQGHVKFK